MVDPYLEAEYADGYVHRQDEQDHSPYVSGKNIFHDILNHLPEAAHGRMVRFSLITAQKRYDVDWTALPDNARPIHLKHMERTWANDGSTDTGPVCLKREFGYQFNDETGRNHKVIEEII